MKSVRVLIYLFANCLLLLPINTLAVDEVDYLNEGTKAIASTIRTIQACIQNDDPEKLSEIINFPLRREYPLKSIRDAEQFVQRYREIVDEGIRETLLSLNPETDWSVDSWRGVMIHSGMVWLMEPAPGKPARINSIWQSDRERETQKRLIAEDRARLYPELREFIKPVIECRTKDYLIRVDLLTHRNLYRYASWKLPKSKGEKPDLVLSNGDTGVVGSAGIGLYNFENGDYTYYLETGFPWKLVVYKGKQQILEQNVLEIGPF